jgi:hypothetical protein
MATSLLEEKDKQETFDSEEGMFKLNQLRDRLLQELESLSMVGHSVKLSEVVDP